MLKNTDGMSLEDIQKFEDLLNNTHANDFKIVGIVISVFFLLLYAGIYFCFIFYRNMGKQPK
jgi:hypothetical protein